MKLPINYEKSSPKQRIEAREEYVKKQNGLCCFCRFSLSEPTPDSVKEKHPLKIIYENNSMIAIPKQKGKTSSFPKGMLDHPIHLHHDHNTGLTIGAIHAYCNVISFVYLE